MTAPKDYPRLIQLLRKGGRAGRSKFQLGMELLNQASPYVSTKAAFSICVCQLTLGRNRQHGRKTGLQLIHLCNFQLEHDAEEAISSQLL